jgi:hypothetical protein
MILRVLLLPMIVAIPVPQNPCDILCGREDFTNLKVGFIQLDLGAINNH